MILWQTLLVPLLWHIGHPTVANVHLLKNVNCQMESCDGQTELLFFLLHFSGACSIYWGEDYKGNTKSSNHLVCSYGRYIYIFVVQKPFLGKPIS